MNAKQFCNAGDFLLAELVAFCSTYYFRLVRKYLEQTQMAPVGPPPPTGYLQDGEDAFKNIIFLVSAFKSRF
jgi:hypothetical protein